jgi:hypothetical protein
MKFDRNVVWHVHKWLRLGNFKMLDNLLGNQVSPKSEDFCIWRPFCTLVTMATAAILIFFNPQKLPHTTVDIPTNTMSRCANYFRNFQNGHHCHGNGQNAKKIKNPK